MYWIIIIYKNINLNLLQIIDISTDDNTFVLLSNKKLIIIHFSLYKIYWKNEMIGETRVEWEKKYYMHTKRILKKY